MVEAKFDNINHRRDFSKVSDFSAEIKTFPRREIDINPDLYRTILAPIDIVEIETIRELKTDENMLHNAYDRATNEHFIQSTDPYMHREDLDRRVENVQRKIEDAFETTRENIDRAVNTVEKRTGEFVDKTKETVRDVTDQLGRDYEWARDKTRETWDKTKDKAEDVYDRTKSTFGQMGEKAKGVAEDIQDKTGQVYDKTRGGIRSAAEWSEDTFNKTKDSIESTYTKTRKDLADAYDRASKTAQEDWRRSRDAVAKEADIARGFLEDKYEKAKSHVNEDYDHTKSAIEHGYTKAKEDLRYGYDKAKETAFGTRDRLEREYETQYKASPEYQERRKERAVVYDLNTREKYPAEVLVTGKSTRELLENAYDSATSTSIYYLSREYRHMDDLEDLMFTYGDMEPTYYMWKTGKKL